MVRTLVEPNAIEFCISYHATPSFRLPNFTKFMAYNIDLANRIAAYLIKFPNLKIEEKEMFSGLAFMVNGKMCINVSGENLMCRFDPKLIEVVAEKRGFLPMIMKGKQLKGYCYVDPIGFEGKKDFEYWIDLCLDFNPKAKSSK